MGDPTADLLTSIDREPAKWVKRRVVAFVPHERECPEQRLSDGSVVKAQTIRVTLADLQREADRANERQARTGQLDAVTIGHRKFDPNFPEHQQPPLVGFARHYRAEWVDRPGGRMPCLTYEECVAADKAAAFDLYRQYPYRSVEYSPSLGLNGVAALLRPPFLNMGTNYVYQGAAMGNGTDWDADDEAGYGEFQTYAAKCGPARLKKYMAKYEAGMAAPGAANAALPEPAPAPAAYQADPGFAAYQAELASLKAQVAAERLSRTTAEVGAQLDKLTPFVRFDRARELKALLAYQSDAERADHLTYMARTYEKLPTAGVDIRVYEGTVGPGGLNPGVPEPFKAPANHEQVMTYMRAHPGMSYAAAETALMK